MYRLPLQILRPQTSNLKPQTFMNPTFFIKIGRLTASQMLTLANSVIAGLTAAVGTYPVPNPTVATLTTDAATLSTAITNRGRKSTPGGALATATLKNAKEVMQADLIQVAEYCMNTTPNSQLDFLSAGFPTYFIHPAGFKAIRKSQRPRNVRALVRRDVNSAEVYLKWKRALGTGRPLYSQRIVNKTWTVQRSMDGTATWSDIALVTKTQFTDAPPDTNPTTTPFWYYRIIGHSADGQSVISDIVKVKNVS